MKIFTKIIILSILLVPLLFACSNENSDNENNTNTVNKDITTDKKFDFILKYGMLEKNILNTYENTYTKNLVSDGVITIPFELSTEEKKIILQEMIDIDIFNISNNFNDYINVTPHSTYSLEVSYKGKTKTLNWTGNNVPLKSINPSEKDPEKAVTFVENDETKQIIDLVKLEGKIERIIQSKNEYKELPKSKGGYQ